MLSKGERLKIFFERLDAAPAVNSESEALGLLSTILNGVEDEYTSIPCLPEQWMDDGRMYPPQADSRRRESDDLARYRNRNHNTYIGSNGAIQITKVTDKTILIDKAGSDGKNVGDL